MNTDIETKELVVNESTEFTVTSTANDDAGKMVKGSFVFSDPDAIEKLEYYETAEGMQGWYELTGDFGPADGFPMINGTSRFRATFNKAGNYSVTVSMYEVSTGETLCQVRADISVKKADITGISISPTSNKYDNGDKYELVKLGGRLKTGEKVSYTIEGDLNVYTEIRTKSAVGEYKVTIKVERDNKYNVVS